MLAVSLACSFTPPISPSQAIPTSTLEAPQGLIAYVGNNGNIYTTDRDGKQVNAVTQDADLNPADGQVETLYQDPTWAPDGQHLAFVRLNGSQTGQEFSLFSALSDGKKRVNTFTSQDFQPFYLSWSPNSQTIAFLASDATGDLAQYLVDASGGKSKLISSGMPYYWDWSPDNQKMIVHIGGAISDNPEARLAVIGVDSSSPDKDLALKPGDFEAPAWAPAGDGLLLDTQNNAGEDDLILADQNGKVKQLLAQLSGPVSFAWSPKGTDLAYAVLDPAGSVPTIRLIVLDSTHPGGRHQIAQGDVAAFFWSPDGQKIAYFVQGSEGPSASSLHTVAFARQTTDLVVWVYDRANGNTQEVAAFTPTDSFQQILPFYSQYQRSGTIWSPDSQDLVLSSVDSNGENAIVTVGADGSHLQKIADGDLAFWSWK